MDNTENNEKENKLMTVEQAQEELEQAEAELETAKRKVREKKAALRFIQGNPRETAKRYIYKVNQEELEALYQNQDVVVGVSDLFKRVLEVREDIKDSKPLDFNETQISVKIRTEGMRKIEQYCTIKQESPRKFYIKAMKNRKANMEMKAAEVNLRDLNRKIKEEEQRAKLEKLKARND